ncbi:DNA-binding transcriptional repressor PuuR [Anaerococcus prevotii]|uniref:Transcriptional regulator, XRE family n=1 Tax=Anaerococcus prevotii (strain ATCC 9321 / DSM 20548 / JCM 6508 / NCTC 11806 / PC1) TaxID=525919 RepID=C7RI64_ANAPD|nr:helix-turn-helix transcriptional regulator [Anaerococcus prevotii]ACV29810.1 transcriptional regulator, XRE family [Anaerococcus prevotii DSM 20548]SUU94313.1 DNA-binding transcriptional repressor PuuR [Anaerococcus prevotii]
MDIIEVFSKNVKKYRNEMGLSQEAFAEKSGFYRTYISALECKKRSIALDNVQKIADALEIETYLLFVEEPEKKERRDV